MNIDNLLPKLDGYKNDFINEGFKYPLNTVPFLPSGLLKDLPATSKSGWPWDIQTKTNVYDQKINWPKITIVTPSYNQGQYIEETIRAVLLQNYPNLEYIVMDGGSTDGTKEILEKYSPWISYWQSKKDNGQGHAINLGFSLASGSIYGWINSDDFYMESAFIELEKGFRDLKTEIIYGDGLVVIGTAITYQKAYLVKNRYLFIGGIIMQHSCFWKAKVHQPILEQLHCAVDSELWFRMIPKKKIKHLAFPLGVMRIQPEAKTHNKKYAQMWKDDNKLIGEINQFEKKFFLFPYFFTRLYRFEVKLVQSIFKYFNKVNTKDYLKKFKEYQ